ncbi:hypothetical protein RFI_27573 [Reticulomyxa filosa]|uniref:Uncharacterized protein n=1 Tax=Reticulomyxa filosa TaxID=46433 RepID=X6M844_RETFI|nr:hypothetical protein RFI_27573 [Reticulomyxa filosa]|eukprot:ETO09806.1 hypothetical protein RFI_27573 [Reticulomyxa filosa]
MDMSCVCNRNRKLVDSYFCPSVANAEQHFTHELPTHSRLTLSMLEKFVEEKEDNNKDEKELREREEEEEEEEKEGDVSEAIHKCQSLLDYWFQGQDNTTLSNLMRSDKLLRRVCATVRQRLRAHLALLRRNNKNSDTSAWATLLKYKWNGKSLDDNMLLTPHSHFIFTLTTNVMFLDVIRLETAMAFAKFFSRHPNTLEKLQHNVALHDVDLYTTTQRPSLAIHFRCGDLLGTYKGHYSFPSFLWYRTAFKQLRLTFGFDLVNNTNTHSTHIRTVFWLINLDPSKMRGIDLTGQKHCVRLMSLLTPHLTAELFPGATLVVLSENTVDADYYILTIARHIICGHSTFCESATRANAHGFAVQRHQSSASPMFNDASYLLSDNIHFVNYTDQFRLSGSIILQQDLTVEQIAQFLVSH